MRTDPPHAPLGRIKVTFRRLAAAAALALLALLGLAGAASASPALPSAPWDCKTAPTASIPDTGLPGFFDPAPDPIPARGDPWATQPSTTLYDQYGYAGLTWNTYDLGCMGGLADVDATIDTFIGNTFMSAGTWLSSATNGIHNRVAHPEQYMQPLDDVVATVTTRLNTAIWSPWGVVAILAVAALLLYYSLHGRLSSVMMAAAWALLVLGIVSGISQYPTRVASFFDQAVTGSIASVNQSSAGLTETAPGDPTRAQGALVVDEILYQAWLRGQFGDPDSPAAKKWGPILFRESTFSRAELAAARAEPDGIQRVTEQKANDWVTTTQEIQDQDPLAYAAIQGKAKGRAGAGFMAFIGALFTALFRLVADLFVFAGLVMLRLLVMFFPAAAVFGVIAPMSTIVRRIGNIAGASVINVIAFGAGAAVHAVAIAAILSHANGTGMGILTLVLCLVVSVAAFILLLPLLSFANILGHSPRGNSLMRTARRSVLGYVVGRKAVEDGYDDTNHRKRRTGKPTVTGEGTDTGEAPTGVGPARDGRRLNLPVESIGRRYDTVTWTQPDIPTSRRDVPGRVTAMSSALPRTSFTAGTRAPEDTGDPGALVVAGPSRVPSSRPSPPPGGSEPSGIRHQDLYDPSSRSTGDLPAKSGTLVDELPSGIREIRAVRTHDCHAEVTDAGVQTRFYDAATKQFITADPEELTPERGEGRSRD